MGARLPEISEEQRRQFASLYLLDYMIKEKRHFDVYLDRADADLEPVLEHMLVKECVAIEDGRYVPTERGRRALSQFMARYSEFLQMFDIFCAVDLAGGEFAFARYFELDDEEWRAYIAEDRFDDLRIAVAEFKKLDPVEIVFMSFLSEGRFGRDGSGWQFDLLLGTVWDEVREIVERALHVSDLGYADGQGRVAGEEVIADVIGQGTALLVELLEEEERRDAQPTGRRRDDAARSRGDIDDDEDGYEVEVVHHPSAYYRPYLDPGYVSPLWLGLLLL